MSAREKAEEWFLKQRGTEHEVFSLTEAYLAGYRQAIEDSAAVCDKTVSDLEPETRVWKLYRNASIGAQECARVLAKHIRLLVSEKGIDTQGDK